MSDTHEVKRKHIEDGLQANGIYLFSQKSEGGSHCEDSDEEIDALEQISYLRKRIKRLKHWRNFFEKKSLTNYIRTTKNATRVSIALMKTETDIKEKQNELRYWQEQAFGAYWSEQ